MKIIKLYDTYNQVKDVFVKPTLHFKACKWIDIDLLPIWRHGNIIHITKHYSDYDYDWRKLNSSYWTDSGKKNHPILSKLFKPMYTLPIWLSFYIFHHDLVWKTKYDEYRYEFPPQLSIVIFGYSFNWWLEAPLSKEVWTANDDYWESVLTFINEKRLHPEKSNREIIMKLQNDMGCWRDTKTGKLEKRLKDEFLKIKLYG